MADTETARLTTHVLDTSLGRPAAGIAVRLARLGTRGDRTAVADTITNDDGRCDAPLMAGDAFEIGEYELTFAAGPYLDASGADDRQPADATGSVRSPRFLSDIVIRFGIAEMRHYHVPLLLSPFGYSTYRGS